MNMNNEYATRLLVAQHQNQLLAEAAEERLARQAREGRPTWLQRLVSHTRRARAPRPAHRLRLRHSH